MRSWPMCAFPGVVLLGLVVAPVARAAEIVLGPPIDDIDTYWSPAEKAQASTMLRCSVVGDADTVRAGLRALIERTKADELMIVSDVFDPELRRRSLEIIAGLELG